MTRRVLVAGVGNIFFRDDGFGVEVARQLAARPLPEDVAVRDIGTGGLHLAFELLEPTAALVVADVVPRGGTPGTLYVVEPELDDDEAQVAHGHGMSLPAVFAQVRSMGGRLPAITIVGCEPADVSEGLGLSPMVEHAVAPAVELAQRIARRSSAAEPAGERGAP